MRRTILAAVTLSCIPFGAAMADNGFVRQILSSGATTASTYMTFRDDKLVAAAREDASSFVASIHDFNMSSQLQYIICRVRVRTHIWSVVLTFRGEAVRDQPLQASRQTSAL